MAGASGKKLDETYKLAWVRGLKTTYYLRTLAATSAEKSTGQGGELNAVSSSGAASGASAGRAMSAKNTPASTHNTHTAQEPEAAQFCGIGDPTCESCQ
jgi:ribonucleoside-diphosphate reductase alpha chain